ncbi:MAG: histidine kinase [Cyclobacteriaceae bacterium]
MGEFFQVVYYIILTHLFRALILRLGWLKYKWFEVLPRFILANSAVAIIQYALLLFTTMAIGTFNPNKDLDGFTIVANLMVSMLLLLFWSLIYLSFHYFDRYNKSLQHEAVLKEIELNTLKSQLNPHFIFNALNGIRALVDENPLKSKNAITQLSNILRNSLSAQRKKLISFEEELTTVKDYLELEHIRYEERLRTSFDLEKGSDQFEIPPLMIQTLVENGIKHGISTLKDGGEISVKSRLINGKLRIEIRNSGKFAEGGTPGVGYGLLNTKKRLELIFGEQSSFKISNETNNIVLTEIIIPKHI